MIDSERNSNTVRIEAYIEQKKHGKGFLSLENLQEIVGTHAQSELYAAILPLLNAGVLAPLKNAKSNGSTTTPLYERYRIVPPPVPEHNLLELAPLLNSTGYLERNPKVCDTWWTQLLALSAWLKAGHHMRDATLRERCWEVFGNEKACDEAGLARCVRNACGRELRELLLVYEDAPEDLPFTVAPGITRPKHILLSENRDPYLAVRRALLAGKTTLFGAPVDAVVYGRGNVARQSGGASLRFALESMRAADQPCVRYWGDVDREGLSILASLCASGNVVPFTEAYEAMLSTTPQHGPRPSPDERTLPMPYIDKFFLPELGTRLLRIAEDGQLLPQEVISARTIMEAMA